MNLKSFKSKVLSLAIAFVMVFGVFSPVMSSADGAVPQVKVYLADENGTKREVATWDFDETAEEYTENGNKLLMTVDDNYLTLMGKTRKPKVEEVLLTKYLTMEGTVEYALGKEKIKTTDINLADTKVGLYAEDGFGFTKTYKELVNMDLSNPTLLNISNFSQTSNNNIGTAFNGVLSIKFDKTAPGGTSSTAASTDGALRYFGGIQKGAAFDDIANLGFDSPSSITQIVVTPAE